MDLLNSPTAALVIKFVAAFAVVLVLIFAAMWIFRFIRGAGLGIGGSSRSRQPRLAVLDFTDVDSRRRLVLVRRDNVEHLILLGGPTDVVVETNIIRGQAAPNPARDLDPSLTTTATTESPQITVPVEPPRTPLRELARAAANEAPRPAAPAAPAEPAPTRSGIPGRSLFSSLSARREPAAPAAVTPPPAPPSVEVTEVLKSGEEMKVEAPKAEMTKTEMPKAEAPKADTSISDEISAKLDAALRKPLTVSPPERRPLPPIPPAPPLRSPAPPVKTPAEPVLETAPSSAPVIDVSELESALSLSPQPTATPAAAPAQTTTPVMPAPPLRAPVFSPPPLRAKPEATSPAMGSETIPTSSGSSPSVAGIPAPPPSAVRGPATPPLTPTERSVFDSLEEEMASLLGRSPKAP